MKARAVTISHTWESGLVLAGTWKGDGSWAVLRAIGWHWDPDAIAWWLPGSAGQGPDLAAIAVTSRGLQLLGFDVSGAVDLE